MSTPPDASPVTRPASGHAVPDPDQAAVIDARDDTLLVLAGPGTGRTFTALRVIVEAVTRGEVSAGRCLLLSPTRRSAGDLRDRLSGLLAATVDRPLVRTPSALAFALLRRHAGLTGEPLPRLLSGAEQDAVLGELLAGHRRAERLDQGPGGDVGAGIGVSGPDWPASVRGALGTRAFRDELRDLLMRVVEQGLEAGDLRELGRRHDRPEWVAAADVMDEYDQVTALSSPGAHDAAWVVARAADLLEDEDEDGAAPDGAERIDLVVVDDAHELTAPAARIVRSLARRGARVVLLGDGDLTVQAFRGADPARFVRLAQDLGARRLVLTRPHRQTGVAAQAADLIRAQIGAAHGLEHRITPGEPPPGDPGTTLDIDILPSAAQEARLVAGILRRAHLRDGVPWSDLAVVVRSTRVAAAVQRALGAGGVPYVETTRVTPLRDEPAARGLLDALDLVLRLAGSPSADHVTVPSVTDAESPGALSESLAHDVVTGPLCGADSVTLRGLRRALRRRTDPSVPDLLAAGLRRAVLRDVDGDDGCEDDAADPDAALAPLHALARILRPGLMAAREPSGSAEDVLWAIWHASPLAARWRTDALAGGVGGERADRALDAVVALMEAAGAYTDRWPGSGAQAFLDQVRGQEVAADSLVPGAPRTDHVEVLTPQSAAGRSWHTVVIAGVQEGVWPDLRLRGSLLGSERLNDLVAGSSPGDAPARSEQVRAVRHDETRQFHLALTRARRRVHLTAVLDETESPSPYLDLLATLTDDALDDGERWRLSSPGSDLTLRGTVAQLRRSLVRATRSGDHAARDRHAALLAVLAAAGVPGADPLAWAGAREDTSERPLVPAGGTVRLSPSQSNTLQDCALQWFLTTRGGNRASTFDSARGTLVHEICAEFAEATVEDLHAELDRRWPELGAGQAWHEQVEYDRTRAMLTRFAAYRRLSAEEGWGLAGVERDVDVRIPLAGAPDPHRSEEPPGPAEVRLAGRADRVEVRDGHVRIVDLKTSRNARSQGRTDADGQLGLYQVAVTEGAVPEGSVPGGGVLVTLGHKVASGVRTNAQAPLDPGGQTWAHELLRESAQAASGRRFQAVAGPECRRCPVAASCPVNEPDEE